MENRCDLCLWRREVNVWHDTQEWSASSVRFVWLYLIGWTNGYVTCGLRGWSVKTYSFFTHAWPIGEENGLAISSSRFLGSFCWFEWQLRCAVRFLNVWGTRIGPRWETTIRPLTYSDVISMRVMEHDGVLFPQFDRILVDIILRKKWMSLWCRFRQQSVPVESNFSMKKTSRLQRIESYWSCWHPLTAIDLRKTVNSCLHCQQWKPRNFIARKRHPSNIKAQFAMFCQWFTAVKQYLWRRKIVGKPQYRLEVNTTGMATQNNCIVYNFFSWMNLRKYM